ncbi:MAG: hypothetical protein ACR2O4_09965 [Hyphomicrobiaceae bacterium]
MRIVPACLGVALFAASLLTITTTDADAGSRKNCRPGGHLHHGVSDSKPTKQSARQSAIEAWSNFTEFEYGAGWGNFKNARYKSVSCFQKEAGWACSVEGNPCKAGRTRSAKK